MQSRDQSGEDGNKIRRKNGRPGSEPMTIFWLSFFGQRKTRLAKWRKAPRSEAGSGKRAARYQAPTEQGSVGLHRVHWTRPGPQKPPTSILAQCKPCRVVFMLFVLRFATVRIYLCWSTRFPHHRISIADRGPGHSTFGFPRSPPAACPRYAILWALSSPRGYDADGRSSRRLPHIYRFYSTPYCVESHIFSSIRT